MIGGKKDFGIRHRGSHPEGWARSNSTLKRALAPVLQHSAMLGPRLSVGTTSAVLILVLSASPTVRLSAQGDVGRHGRRPARLAVVPGLARAMVGSLQAVFHWRSRDGPCTLPLPLA